MMLAHVEFKPRESGAAVFRNRLQNATFDDRQGVAKHRTRIILTDCPRTWMKRWSMPVHELRTKWKTFFRWPTACEQSLVQNANYVWTGPVRITL